MTKEPRNPLIDFWKASDNFCLAVGSVSIKLKKADEQFIEWQKTIADNEGLIDPEVISIQERTREKMVEISSLIDEVKRDMDVVIALIENDD